MGGLLVLITLFGVWLVVAAVLDWDWSLGTIDLTPAEATLGTEAVRWGVCVVGLALLFLGMGGCTR